MSQDYRFVDVIDVDSLQGILDNLSALTNVAVALTDADVRVLAQAGRQEICETFHQPHPEAGRHCVRRTLPARDVVSCTDGAAGPVCPHGLIESCCPIEIEGTVVAQVWAGQFFHDVPGSETRRWFRELARRYGFAEDAYLTALDRVPVVTPEVHARVVALLTALAAQLGRLGVARISEQRRGDQIQHNEKLLHLVMEAFEDGFWDWRIPDDTVVWSSQCYRMLGYQPDTFPEHIEEWRNLIHPDDREVLIAKQKETLRHGDTFSHEFRLRAADGNFVWVHGRGRIIERTSDGRASRMVGTIADISERKTAEEQAAILQQQLRQAQKLEAIGALAGGIAHDFNNILGAMIGFTDLVAEDLPADSAQGRNLQKVLQAGHRARDLIGQILAFSRQAKPERVALQPQTIVKEVVKLLRSTLPATITIKQSIDPACDLVDIDPSQFHQVLMNLCTNAFHAMEERGGTLGIVLRPAANVPERLRRQAERSGEQYLELLVSDTGHGINKALVDKIFDPFFTTKEENKGTGMGLSIVFGIVSEYGGAVTVESEEGSGSVFRVFLPFTRRPAQEAEPETASLSGGDEHIMLVDDEALLLEMTGKVLQRLGYTVTRVGDGRQALELFRAEPQRYDLVITDQTMPGLTGMDLAARLLALRPELPVLLCTGYSAGISEEKVVQAGLKGLLYKPLLRKDLAGTIRRVLQGRTIRTTVPGEA